jgi:diaminopropionate ammonia-lyase
VRFHEGLAGYVPTPLTELPMLAEELGVGRVFVKDESSRLGLPAFKALGASWATFRALVAHLNVAPEPSRVEELAALLDTLQPMELVAATDGNHGRAVARMARLLGLTARIFVPNVLLPPAVDAIAGEGATVVTVGDTYDEAVAEAGRAAEASDRTLLIQDMGWPGYEQIPRWIVEGYSTLFVEVDRQLAAAGAGPAALVVVPVGVGSLAQAAVTHHRSQDGSPPALLSVEPDSAGCVLASLHAGALRSVPTATTIMAGLNCGTPSELAWPVLQAGLDAAVLVRDEAAGRAVRDLEALAISSGPCGAATLAGARAALRGHDRDERRAGLGIDAASTVILVSTESSAAYLAAISGAP